MQTNHRFRMQSITHSSHTSTANSTASERNLWPIRCLPNDLWIWGYSHNLDFAIEDV